MTYEQIIKRLKAEQLTFPAEVKVLEGTVSQKEGDYEQLLMMSHDANQSKEHAKQELGKFEALVSHHAAMECGGATPRHALSRPIHSIHSNHAPHATRARSARCASHLPRHATPYPAPFTPSTPIMPREQGAQGAHPTCRRLVRSARSERRSCRSGGSTCSGSSRWRQSSTRRSVRGGRSYKSSPRVWERTRQSCRWGSTRATQHVHDRTHDKNYRYNNNPTP